MRKKVYWFAICLMAAGAFSCAWGEPTIENTGSKVLAVSGAYGPRGSIAVDSGDNPHIVMTTAPGSDFYFCDYTGSGFSVKAYSSSIYNSPLFGSAHMEIDADDMAWISATFWWPNMGIGVVCRPDVKNNPGAAPIFNSGDIWIGPYDVGNLSLDPGKVGSAFFASHRGVWERYEFINGAAHDVESGSVEDGAGGEKAFFHISKAGDVPHSDGTSCAVKNHCTEYSYNNSLRAASGIGWYKWADWNAYPGMLTDHAYPAVMSDKKEPLVAYMAAEYTFAPPRGVFMNVWKGTDGKGNGDCVFPSSALLCIDPAGHTGIGGRYEVQLAAANNGGCWVTWIRDNRARLRYIPSTITVSGGLNDCGPEVDVCAASAVSTICVDSDGNIHMVYIDNGATMYRLIEVDGDSAGQAISSYLAGDYNGDGLDDLCVYYPKAGYWFVSFNNADEEKAFKENMSVNWGYEGAIPVPADYTGDGATDIAVYIPENGLWLVRDSRSGMQIISKNWGWSESVPVPADYDGDGKADIAVYYAETGYWMIWSSEHQAFWQKNLGYESTVPVPADYDGNGNDDIAVYVTENGAWYAYDMENNAYVNGYDPGSRDPVNWGWSEARPVPADYDADGKADRAVYFSGDWIIDGSTSGKIDAQLGGGENEIPVPGKYWNKYLPRGGQEILGRAQVATYLPEYGLWQLKDVMENWSKNKTHGWEEALPPKFLK